MERQGTKSKKEVWSVGRESRKVCGVWKIRLIIIGLYVWYGHYKFVPHLITFNNRVTDRKKNETHWLKIWHEILSFR